MLPGCNDNNNLKLSQEPVSGLGTGHKRCHPGSNPLVRSVRAEKPVAKKARLQHPHSNAPDVGVWQKLPHARCFTRAHVNASMPASAIHEHQTGFNTPPFSDDAETIGTLIKEGTTLAKGLDWFPNASGYAFESSSGLLIPYPTPEPFATHLSFPTTNTTALNDTSTPSTAAMSMDLPHTNPSWGGESTPLGGLMNYTEEIGSQSQTSGPVWRGQTETLDLQHNSLAYTLQGSMPLTADSSQSEFFSNSQLLLDGFSIGGWRNSSASNQGSFASPSASSGAEESARGPSFNRQPRPAQEPAVSIVSVPKDWSTGYIQPQAIPPQTPSTIPSRSLMFKGTNHDESLQSSDLISLDIVPFAEADALRSGQQLYPDTGAEGIYQRSWNGQLEGDHARRAEAIAIGERSGDADSPCKCEISHDGTPCPPDCNGARPWVVVTYNHARAPIEQEKKRPKMRSKLEDDARRQTVATRDTGACIRCKIQRCIPDLMDPGGPCERCSRVALNFSKKVLHHIACYRFKLQEVVLFRTSAPGVGSRWRSPQVSSVVSKGRPLFVDIMHELVSFPFRVHVREVDSSDQAIPQASTTWEWYDGTRSISEPVSDCALIDVQIVSSDYKIYIRDSILSSNHTPAIKKVAENYREASYDTGVVGEVYERAWEYFSSLLSANETWSFFYDAQLQKRFPTSGVVSEKEFLLGLFELQFAMRQATGWSWILEGSIPHAARVKQFPPLEGRVSTPRPMAQQIDYIRTLFVLSPLAKSIMKVLMGWIAGRNYDRWLSIFFATFILLAEIAKVTEDAYHHGWYDINVKRTGPRDSHMIRELHETANVILAHWHYFNCGVDPSTLPEGRNNVMEKTPLRALGPEQIHMAQEMWVQIKQWKQRPSDGQPYGSKTTCPWWEKWCHSMYFADQMVDEVWTARDVFP